MVRQNTGRKRDAVRTKGSILQAAIAEFALRGPAGTRVDEIAARAGVNKSLIYQYFGSKQELYAEALNAVLEDIEDLAAAFPRWEDNVGRQVHPGEFYTYDGTDVYRVVQGHVTQADWSPPLTPALFLHLPPAGSSGCPPFVQPTGAHDAYAIGDCVEFEGANYVSLIDANAYSPSAYPAGWELQE